MRPTKFRTYFIGLTDVVHVVPAEPHSRRVVFSRVAPGIINLAFSFEEARLAFVEGDIGRVVQLTDSVPFPAVVGPREEVFASSAGIGRLTVAVADAIIQPMTERSIV